MGQSLETIGTRSTISVADSKWLDNLVGILRDHGEHTKAIYLDKMLQNSIIIPSEGAGNRKIFDFDTFVKIANRGKDRDFCCWEMYADDMVGHIVHDINSEILNQLKLNASQTTFKFTYTYDKLYEMTHHRPPFHNKGGMRQIATQLMHTINGSFDWEMKVKKAKGDVLIFSVRKTNERAKMAIR